MNRSLFYILLGSVVFLAVVVLTIVGKTSYQYLQPHSFSDFQKKWTLEFKQEYKPQIELPIDQINKARIAAELKNLELSLPHFFKYDFEEIKALNHFSMSCDEPRQIKKSASLMKTWKWHESICNKIELPSHFNEVAPYIHPSGQSFAKLMLMQNSSSAKDLENKLTIPELIKFKYKLNDITLDEIQSLLNRTEIVIGSNNVFLFNEKELSDFAFDVYNRKQWDQFIEKASFELAPRVENKICLQQIGNLCWQEKVNSQQKLIRILLICLIVLISILLFVYVFYSVKNKKIKRSEEEKRKFALQMLTHELRTPATSLAILVENIRNSFDELTEQHKINFFKICDEVSRLQQVTKLSYQYLQTDSLKNNINQKREQKNLIQFINQIIQKNNYDLKIESPAQTVMITFDWYWLEICLDNLIKNAFSHGAKPIYIKIVFQNNDLFIWVIDSGQLKISKELLFQPFSKSSNSQGLGLGLTIVKSVLESLKISLILETVPTTKFGLKINRENYAFTIS